MISVLNVAETVYRCGDTNDDNDLLRYIGENIGQKLTLTGLCEHFHTNRTTLTRKIKELTGLPP